MIKIKQLRSFLCVSAYIAFLTAVLWFGQIRSKGEMLSPGYQALFLEEGRKRAPSSDYLERQRGKRTLIPLF